LKQIYGPERFSQVTDDATMTPALKKYISYMYDTVEANPAYLVGHSYTRYLGDLAGNYINFNMLE
jgi:heme oxygenase